MAGVRGLAHANIRAPAAMIERLRRFYIDVIGLREGPRPRPRSGSHGHWLYAGAVDVLHLTVAAPGDAPPQATGFLDHLAFACSNLPAVRARLDAAGMSYDIDELDARAQLFLTDPAGLRIELNFQR